MGVDDERSRVPDLIAFTDSRGFVIGFAARVSSRRRA
jgi:hypothetical protein